MNTKQKQSKKNQLIVLYGSYCWWCGNCMTQDKLTLEHLMPKSLGGTNSLENLRLACFSCNNNRGNSLFPPKWKRGSCV
ncbi:HNH endonuclease [Tolypothrix tenuis PCC 7101]|uniref:HNH endonuclease n=1 Tax=Tolypothrix tenuis PCC 7101 TaxID=231146 RepID=A0A1Z4N233_9CYAN|nr:HNH endonuclease [Aulosira sp. FACHB-113]BAY99691.1 HNH endonuclease [Tolypothrix tenuis PCC 7101]BAZ76387.1 HNH endonuclease [Aulosira laxa NIES-50]